MSSRANKDRLSASIDRTGLVVRRTFSMQEADAKLIEALRVRYATQGMLMNQSEVIRVGLQVLSDMDDRDLRGRAAKLERLAVVRAKSSG